MKVLVAIWGSTGDILPSLAIGRELKRRGHAVAFAANPYFQGLAERAGLEVLAVGERAHHEAMMADNDLFDAQRLSPIELLEKHYFPRMADFHRVAAQAFAAGARVLVGGELGSIAAAQVAGVPWFKVAASPGGNTGIDSRSDPLHPERPMPRPLRWLAGSGRGVWLYWRLHHARHGLWRWPRLQGEAAFMTDEARAFRVALGLRPEFDCAPREALCMWPAHFAPAQRDWPPRMRVCGFPLYPRPQPPLPRAERRLVVITTGTLAAAQDAFYDKAVAAFMRLGRPDLQALLVSPNQCHIPASLPEGVRHVAHAPFDELIGRAALVVHHGGIGTAAYALAAGVPQLMMPMRGDQFDNANRVQRLGTGRMMSAARDSVDDIARTMARLIDSESVAARCAHWRERTDAETGVRQAADRVETVVAPRRAGPRAGGALAAAVSGSWR
ncbi:nucleotide disphospho-sugar-binding domain-containing protein [Ideonella sp. DXS22W]|uniref:Nucleotide disphospho-sugar-binding domain-containing protein n=1 Tax=Pseudaquabacterium inlustre TaxID=2984192 RepID=A0ABU9CKN9_9BURK